MTSQCDDIINSRATLHQWNNSVLWRHTKGLTQRGLDFSTQAQISAQVPAEIIKNHLIEEFFHRFWLDVWHPSSFELVSGFVRDPVTLEHLYLVGVGGADGEVGEGGGGDVLVLVSCSSVTREVFINTLYDGTGKKEETNCNVEWWIESCWDQATIQAQVI